MTSNVRFYEIDLLRFTSALMVVVFHYTFVGYMLDYAPQPRADALGIFSRYFYMGINFFFTISGFVILMSARDGEAGRFAASRFLRLYPAYWLGVALTSGAIIIFNQPQFSVSWSQVAINFTMLQSAFDVPAVESAYWTLWIELKFYAVIFVMAFFKRLRWLPHLAGVVLALSLAVLFHPYAKTVNPFINAFPHWWGYFACGCVFYLVRRDGLNKTYAALLILGLLFSIKQALVFTELMSGWYQVPFNAWVAVTMNCAFFGLFALIALRETNPLRRPGFYALGVLTYPLYIIHQNIGYLVFNQWHSQVPAWLLVSGTLVLMLGLAWLVHRYVEVPFSRTFKPVLARLLSARFSAKSKNVEQA